MFRADGISDRDWAGLGNIVEGKADNVVSISAAADFSQVRGTAHTTATPVRGLSFGL